MTILHINRPRGYFCAQVRGRGCRKWRFVGKHFRKPEPALAKAVAAMSQNDHRARAIFVDLSGWYDPHVAMEAKRT